MTVPGTSVGQTLPPDVVAQPLGALDLLWFLSSKEPGTNMEYALMPGSSNPLLESALVETGATATPSSSNQGRAAEMPWVTFCGGQARAPILAVISTEWSDARDGTGTEITPTRGLYADWMVYAELPTSFESMYSGLRDSGWTSLTSGPAGERGGAVGVSCPWTDWGQVASKITELGLDWCAEVAAALIDNKRVAILSPPDPLSRIERIRVLDAVLALLPYGARNAITASTWAASSTRHKIALCFTDQLGEGQTPVQIGRTVQLTRLGRAGARYRDRLYEILTEDKKLLSDLVDHLSRERRPWNAVDANEAFESISVLQYPKIVYREIRDNRGAVQRVCAVLTGEDQQYPNEYRAAFIRFLAIAGCVDSADGRTAKNTLRSEWSAGLSRYLGAVVREGVAGEASMAPSTWLDWARTGLENAPDSMDAYVSAAFGAPLISPENRDYQAFVTLASMVLNSRTPLGVGSVGTLLDQPYVLIRALGSVGSEGTTREQGLLRKSNDASPYSLVSSAIRLSRPSWVRAVLAVLSDQEHPQADDLQELARLGPAAVIEAIIVGVQRSNGAALERLFPALVASFKDHESYTEADRSSIEELVSMSPQLSGCSKSILAWLDVLAVKAERDPRYLTPTTALSDEYLGSLKKTWSMFPGAIRGRSAQAIAWTILVGGIGQTSINALDRLAAVFQPDFVLDALPIVAERLSQERAQCAGVEFPTQWSERLAELPQLGWFKALRELELLVSVGASSGQVVEAVCVAFRSRCVVEEVISRLVRYLAIMDPAVIDDILFQLSGHQGFPDICTDIRNLILDDQCGVAGRKRFQEYVNRKRRWYGWMAGSNSNAEK